jgi:Type VI secretion system effector, Hcp
MTTLRKLLLCMGIVAVLTSITSPAFAAQKFLLTIEGTKQGKLKGESKIQGHEGWTEGGKVTIGEFDMSVTDQRGLLDSLHDKRKHHPTITIVREVDSASPLLWQALVTNETFTTATIDFIDIANGSKAAPKVIHHLLINGGEYSVKRIDKGKVEIVILPRDLVYQ